MLWRYAHNKNLLIPIIASGTSEHVYMLQNMRDEQYLKFADKIRHLCA